MEFCNFLSTSCLYLENTEYDAQILMVYVRREIPVLCYRYIKKITLASIRFPINEVAVDLWSNTIAME